MGVPPPVIENVLSLVVGDGLARGLKLHSSRSFEACLAIAASSPVIVTVRCLCPFKHDLSGGVAADGGIGVSARMYGRVEAGRAITGRGEAIHGVLVRKGAKSCPLGDSGNARLGIFGVDG